MRRDKQHRRWGARFKAMGSLNEVQVYASTPTHAKAAIDAVIAHFLRVEAKYSRYLESSVVSQINAAAGRSAVAVDEETAYLLDHAAMAYSSSGGLFDITSGILRRVWHTGRQTLPTPYELRSTLQLVGWDKVLWHRPFFFLPCPGMEIDLGGLAKEYAVDTALSILRRLDLQRVLVNGGGDIAALDGHPDGRPWHVGIRSPEAHSEVQYHYPLVHGAIATSGDYERYLLIEGTRYSHIANPRSGWPVCRVKSVSVVGSSTILAGIMTTVAMLKEHDAINFLSDSDCEYLVMSEKGVYLEGGFTPVSQVVAAPVPFVGGSGDRL